MGRGGVRADRVQRRGTITPCLLGGASARRPLRVGLGMLAGALLALLAGRAVAIVAHGRVPERAAVGIALQDGSLQALYAVMLELELAAEDIERDPDGARGRVDRSIDRLSGAIADLRACMLGLAPVG